EVMAAQRAASVCAGLGAAQRSEYLRSYHAQERAATFKQWNDDLAKVQGSPSSIAQLEKVVLKGPAPSAQAAGKLAVSKSAVESPVLKSIQGRLNIRMFLQPSDVTDETWARIAELHTADAQLDARARAVVLDKSSAAAQASQRAVSKRLVENP